jgi:uncharacterized protein (TIGR00162 family)
MKETEIHVKKEVSLKSPVLIEGLPGIGLVGRIAAEHLVNELKAEKFAELYSPDFPPQVIIEDDSTVRLFKDDLYYYKAHGKEQRDLLIVLGDHQGLTPQSYFNICGDMLDFAEGYGAKEIITLGGLAIGKMSKEPSVFGAVTHKQMARDFKKHGVIFENRKGQAIAGAAGLLLGLGQLRGMKGICLMGETQGNYVDPKAAKSVLEILNKYLNLNVNLADLDKKAKETEEMISRLEQIQKSQRQPGAQIPKDESSTYIR